MRAAVGALLLCLCCVAAGYSAYRRLDARVRLLTAFMTMFERLAGELSFRLTPLPELGTRLAEPQLAGFWQGVDLRCRMDMPYAEAWRKSVEELELSPVDKQLLWEAGEILGQYDADNQSALLRLVRQQLEVSLTLARERRQKQGRMYGMLGVLGGLFVLVLLL